MFGDIMGLLARDRGSIISSRIRDPSIRAGSGTGTSAFFGGPARPSQSTFSLRGSSTSHYEDLRRSPQRLDLAVGCCEGLVVVTAKHIPSSAAAAAASITVGLGVKAFVVAF